MLKVSELAAGYGRIPILSGITFSVQDGEFVGVLGHNGMGKTTLLKALMGFLPATAGRIALAGADITHAEPACSTISGWDASRRPGSTRKSSRRSSTTFRA